MKKFIVFGLFLLLASDVEARRFGKRKWSVEDAPLAKNQFSTNQIILQSGVVINKDLVPKGFIWVEMKQDNGTTIIILPQKNVHPKTGELIPWTPDELRFMDHVRSLANPYKKKSPPKN